MAEPPITGDPAPFITISQYSVAALGAGAMWGANWFRKTLIQVLAMRLGGTSKSGNTAETDRLREDLHDHREETNNRYSVMEKRIEDGFARIHQRIDQLFESDRRQK